jgi:uncharacterized iron-regulated protein
VPYQPHTVPAVLTAAALFVASLSAAAGSEPRVGDTGSDEILDTRTQVVDLDSLTDLNELVGRLADRRVVFVGESHDRYEDHLNQLAIIEGLHRQGRDLAIGMEFFQQPFQEALDVYVAGTLSEKEMLRRTGYFERWRFDYRLYRPILRFAREHGIPLIALNVESEITGKVGDGGIASLSEAERARIPAELDRDDAAYRERLRAVYEHHPAKEGGDFEHFLEVQLLWDEGMAERAARYLGEHPGKTLVVLAGAGHLEYGQGIPKRVLRRIEVPSAIVLNGTGRDLDPGIADFLLYPRRVELPASGLLGVLLDTESDGQGIGVKGFGSGSGAEEAGVASGDRIVRVGEEAVGSYADVRIALIGSRPGQKVPIEVVRKRLLGEERLTFEVELR